MRINIKIIVVILTICILNIICNVLAVENENLNVTQMLKTVQNSLEVDKYLQLLDSYAKDNNLTDFVPNNVFENVISGKGVSVDSILSNVTIDVKQTIKYVLTVFVVIILASVLKSVELDSQSDVTKISSIIIHMSLSAILLKNYIEIVGKFFSIVKTLSYTMQITSTFLTGIMIATGKITTIGVTEPLFLFVTNCIVVLTEYVVIPFFTISIIIKIISNMSDEMKLDKMSGMFRKSSLYIFSTMLGIFMLVLSMQTTVTKSIDNLYYKTAQDVVSDTVPVVGKFLSDSLNTVIGATELIGKTGGIVSIIFALVLVSRPIIKLLIIILLYKLLICVLEPINVDKVVVNTVDDFAKVYTQILGILIGIMVLFVTSTGVIMGIISKVT